MRDLERLSNVPGFWILIGIVAVMIVGAWLIDRYLEKQYDGWIDDLDLRHAFQPSHLEESEAAAIARMHLEHQERNTHQTAVQ
jgi:hypothetical protein